MHTTRKGLNKFKMPLKQTARYGCNLEYSLPSCQILSVIITLCNFISCNVLCLLKIKSGVIFMTYITLNIQRYSSFIRADKMV